MHTSSWRILADREQVYAIVHLEAIYDDVDCLVILPGNRTVHFICDAANIDRQLAQQMRILRYYTQENYVSNYSDAESDAENVG